MFHLNLRLFLKILKFKRTEEVLLMLVLDYTLKKPVSLEHWMQKTTLLQLFSKEDYGFPASQSLQLRSDSVIFLL
jgi:hypothetical protein